MIPHGAFTVSEEWMGWNGEMVRGWEDRERELGFVCEIRLFLILIKTSYPEINLPAATVYTSDSST